MGDELRRGVPTVITGVVGDDIHVIGIRVLEHALRNAGFTVVSLGAQVAPEEFIQAAVETAAGAILVSSLSGHAELFLRDFRAKCDEAGLDGIKLYVGGFLGVGRQKWDEVEAKYRGFGFDRVYAPGTPPERAIADLRAEPGAPAVAGPGGPR
ncbi:MAG: methylaspartate mutase subunit S [Candidatus Rokubacteria bacterium]|nr:methylaspartate mutase subunit S [Candidatus Rokubacteria bacterium]